MKNWTKNRNHPELICILFIFILLQVGVIWFLFSQNNEKRVISVHTAPPENQQILDYQRFFLESLNETERHVSFLFVALLTIVATILFGLYTTIKTQVEKSVSENMNGYHNAFQFYVFSLLSSIFSEEVDRCECDIRTLEKNCSENDLPLKYLKALREQNLRLGLTFARVGQSLAKNTSDNFKILESKNNLAYFLAQTRHPDNAREALSYATELFQESQKKGPYWYSFRDTYFSVIYFFGSTNQMNDRQKKLLLKFLNDPDLPFDRRAKFIFKWRLLGALDTSFDKENPPNRLYDDFPINDNLSWRRGGAW